MSFWDKLFRKSKGKVTAGIPANLSRPVKVSQRQDDLIKDLRQRAEKFGRSEADNQQVVLICSELLDLLDESSPYVLYALRERAVALNLLNDYDAALQDIRRELEIRQRGEPEASAVDKMRLRQCQDFLQETLDRKRRAEIEASDSETAQKLKAMEQQALMLMSTGTDADTAFESLFADLQNDNSDVRAEASRLLANHASAVERLIAIYLACLDSDPYRASLAGRVLGRKIAGTSDDIVLAQNAKIAYGIAVSFIPGQCVYCGTLNRGVAAPPAAPWVPFYHSENKAGAYSVPVLCDKCGKVFFVMWETDPR